MKTNSMKKEKFNALKTLCELSRKLEDSKTALFNVFMPDYFEKTELQDEDDKDCFRNNRDRKTLQASEVPAVQQKIKEFAKYLKMSEVESMLVVAAFSKSIDNRDNSFDMSDLTSFFDFKTIDFLPLRSFYDKLVDDGVFVPSNFHRSSFKVETTLTESIQNNTTYVKSKKKELDRYDFCSMASDIISKREDEKLGSEFIYINIEKLEKNNPNLDFVKNVKKVIPEIMDRALFYKCCDDLISRSSNETDMEDALRDIYDFTNMRFCTASDLMDGTHPLMVNDLIEKSGGSFVSEVTLTLTDKGKELFLENDIQLYAKSSKNENLKLPENIQEKRMFYDSDLKQKIDFLAQSLMNENFVNLQQRLEEKSMPKGVAVIFYGAPGTGKTETAMQIARKTGRKVYHVDISASKSMWFGESEKIVKSIFTDYGKMCKDEKLKPILLFNEADALFSKRKNVDSSNVAQTENAIQNIILEELEKLDGILIATTNLADNLDSAFERRFIFKIRFDKPTIKAKQNIWQNKLAWLSQEQSLKLASDYDFSGGEIDNIVRKIVMDEVISGTRPNFDFIIEQCQNERLTGKGRAKIGF